LSDYDFPAANQAILNALILPELIAITPDSGVDEIRSYIAGCLRLQAGNRPGIIQLRAPRLTQYEFLELTQILYPQCQQAGVKLVCNCPLDWIKDSGEEFTDGLHLSVNSLNELWDGGKRPVTGSIWLSASVHNLDELERAQQLGVDYVLLSPLKETSSHPDAKPLSESALKEILDNARVPVYGLGGLTIADLREVKKLGMQGIAGISAFNPSIRSATQGDR